ncbi:Optomotor-blind protein [Actinidia chinensis var. chinensis]|uniref:Optomotor-blind protein n=1 Tax=Actinidia chinensis var. chinensis TaxID=1590841 RepID=A0A2R6RTL8_ACTCC|nr:Optomotor-blind protein [Actinidia chinensis var. chinensis]
MRYLNSVGLALSLVFGCLFLALLAEIYYLLWWKRRITNREIEDDYISPTREFLYMFCWKNPSSLSSTALNPQELSSSMRVTDTHVHEPQAPIQGHPNKDLWPNPFGDDDGLQDLSGPPRFLFTIKEETKEDLESQDGRSRKGSRNRSLSDMVLTVETPFLTPIASPPYFTPPLTPMDFSHHHHHHHGFSPLFGSPIRSSPPPKFKFLKDAEDKLYRRRLVEEAETGAKAPSTSELLKDEEDGTFITLNIVGKNEERKLNHHSSSSQVLPLSSSPSTFRPPTNKKPPISH